MQAAATEFSIRWLATITRGLFIFRRPALQPAQVVHFTDYEVMPKTPYRQHYLYSKKAIVYLLHSQGKGHREIARLLKVNRRTLSIFLSSPAYREFVLSMEGDKAVKEILEKWPELSLPGIVDHNEEDREAVRQRIREKYPELYEVMK